MTRYEGAIAAEEADRAFAALRGFDHHVLAVSGGPDSLALLVLIAEWRARFGGAAPCVSVATVDHGLRAEAAQEARAVGDIAASLGLPHTILDWTGDKPASGVANAAREARYRLLDGFAQNVAGGRSVVVVTAHHQDDQAETFWMRLMRGGGVTALAAMPRERPLHDSSPVRLVRPLLGFPKARLIATVARRGWAWADDPTNENSAYERVRVRAAFAAEAEIDPAALARAAGRMRDAADGLDYAARAFETSIALTIEAGIFARFDRAAFDAAPAILRQMVLVRLIGPFGGASRAPELSEIEALAARFGADATFTATLGGAVTSVGPRNVRVWREVGRIAAEPVALQPGVAVRWDERFLVHYDGGAGRNVNVRPAGRDARMIDASRVKDVPAAALAGLPAFYDGATLLGVPNLTNVNGMVDLFNGLRLVSHPIPYTVPGSPLTG